MRYTYIFEKPLDTTTVQELIDVLHQHEKINLYIATEGGYIFPTVALIDYLNSRKDDIEIYFTDRIMSAGMLIMCDFKGKKYLTSQLDFIMGHVIDSESYSRRKDEFKFKHIRNQQWEDNKKLKEKLKKLGLTSKELNKFEQGKDVILYQKDFHRLNIPFK